MFALCIKIKFFIHDLRLKSRCQTVGIAKDHSCHGNENKFYFFTEAESITAPNRCGIEILVVVTRFQVKVAMTRVKGRIKNVRLLRKNKNISPGRELPFWFY